jgi:hypothetical protein
MRLTIKVCGGNRGEVTCSDLPLTFEGKRAFVIWDSTTLGDYVFLARIEINPKLLRKVRGRTSEYSYQGELVIPRPQDN